MQDILHVLYFFLIKSNLKKMGHLKSNFQLQLAAKLVRDTFYPFTNGFSKRGALGYIRNRKTEGKNHPKPQNHKKIRPKPKTA